MLARVSTNLILLVLSIIFATAICLVIGWRPQGGVMGLVLLYSFAMIVGIVVSMVADGIGMVAGTPQATSQVIGLPLMILSMCSSGFIPPERFPEWIQPFVRNQPVSQITNALRALDEVQPELVPHRSRHLVVRRPHGRCVGPDRDRHAEGGARTMTSHRCDPDQTALAHGRRGRCPTRVEPARLVGTLDGARGTAVPDLGPRTVHHRSDHPHACLVDGADQGGPRRHHRPRHRVEQRVRLGADDRSRGFDVRVDGHRPTAEPGKPAGLLSRLYVMPIHRGADLTRTDHRRTGPDPGDHPRPAQVGCLLGFRFAEGRGLSSASSVSPCCTAWRSRCSSSRWRSTAPGRLNGALRLAAVHGADVLQFGIHAVDMYRTGCSRSSVSTDVTGDRCDARPGLGDRAIAHKLVIVFIWSVSL